MGGRGSGGSSGARGAGRGKKALTPAEAKEIQSEVNRMSTAYKGYSDDFEYRVADINFNMNDTEAGQKAFDMVSSKMADKGWDIDQVTESYASIQVTDRTEYNHFMADWKASKKEVREELKKVK